MTNGGGYGFDVSTLDRVTANADRRLKDMVANSALLKNNLQNAFGGSFDNILGRLQGYLQNIGSTVISPKIDTKEVNNLLGLMQNIVTMMQAVSNDGQISIFDTNNVYNTNKSLVETEATYNNIRERIKEIKKEIAEYQSTDVAKLAIDTFEAPINSKTNKPYGKKSKVYLEAEESYKKEIELLYKKATLGKEIELRELIEKQAIAKEELEWTKKTEDEKAKYIQQTLNKMLNEEKKFSSEVKKEYNSLGAEVLKIFSQVKKYNKSIAKGESSGADVSADKKNVAKLENMLAERRAAMQTIESNFGNILVKEIENFWTKANTTELKALDERIAQMREAEKQYLSTPKGALESAQNAKTMNEMIAAQKNLMSAQGNVDTTTPKGMDTIKELQKEYDKLKGRLEELQGKQKDSNTLIATETSKYNRLLVEIGKYEKVLQNLRSTESYKNQSQDALNKEAQIQDYIAILEKRKTLFDQNATYIKDAEAKYNADRASAEVALVEQTERRKAEIARQRLQAELAERSKYGSISTDSAGRIVGLSQNTENISQAKAAIEKLIAARAHLNKNDLKYEATLERVNKEIKRQEDYIRSVTHAEEEQKRKRQAQNETFSGAMNYAKQAKSINEMQQAVKNLEVARNKENVSTKLGLSRYNQMTREIERLNNVINIYRQKSDEVGRSHRGLMDISGQLARKLALVFSVSQVQGYINKMMAIRGEFELQKRSLTAIIQDEDKANKIWDKTVALAVKSPFRVKELVTYTKQLAAYRVEADKLYETNKMLADVSAGLGVDMQRLILAFGQVKAANYLRGTELRQFSEAGINILGELAKYFTELEGKAVSVADVFDRVSRRMVSFADVETIFKRITSDGGIFYNMQEIQSETLKGKISNLKDSIDIMFNDLGESIDGTLKLAVDSVKVLVDNFYKLLTILGSIVSMFGLYKLSLLTTNKLMIRYAISMNLANVAATRHLTLMQLIQITGARLSKVFSRIGKGLLTMWPVAAVLAFVGAIVAVVSHYNRLRKAAQEINEERDKELAKIGKLSFKYKELSKEGKSDNQILSEKKKLLKELIDLVNDSKSSNDIKLKIDFSELNKKNIDAKFNELQGYLRFAEEWGASLQYSITQGLEAWELFGLIGDNLESDLQDLSDSYRETTGASGVYKTLETLEREIDIYADKLNETGVELYNQLKKGKYPLETEVEWLKRKNILLADIADNLQKGAKIELHNLNALDEARDAWSDLKISQEEAARELDKVANRIISLYGDLDLSTLKKEQQIMLRTQIDQAFEKMQLDEQTKRFASHYLAQKFKIPYELVPTESIQVQLKGWRKSYKSLFEGIGGYFRSINNETKQVEVIEYLQTQLKEVEGTIKRIKAAGGVSATLQGGAYEGLNLAELERELDDIRKQIEWFGAEENKDSSSKTNKTLDERIKLLKELNKQYRDLRKNYDEATAKQKVSDAYADVFREVFSGTTINLTTAIIDDDKLKELKEKGKDIGTAISEGVLEELNSLKENNTYIRAFDEFGASFTKKWEQPILKAKDVEKKGEGYTIGYGEYKTYKDTGERIKAGDTITKEKAEERFVKYLYPLYQGYLNDVLDKNKDLILTQKQYNALLDLTYQGGKGAAENIIKYAKNVELGLAHIVDIRKKLADTYGEDALLPTDFGEGFQKQFMETKSIYERLAMLMRTMNLTVSGGKIDTELIRGMRSRAEDRASVFSGSLNISELLGQVTTDISQFDFTSLEGLASAIRDIINNAEDYNLDAEGVKKAKKSLAEIEAQIGKEKQESALIELDKTFKDLFDRLDSTIELKKLGLSDSLVEALFDFTGVELPSLKEYLNNLKPEFEKLGEDGVKLYQEFQNKVQGIEKKDLEERIKTYAKYMVKGQSERVKIKLEELRQIEEIEKTFNEKIAKLSSEYAKMGLSDEDMKASREYSALLNWRDEAIKGVRKESNESMDKQVWEDFKGSELYSFLFTDMEYLGTKAIEVLKNNLEGLKESLTHLPLDQYKELVKEIEKLENLEIEANPFKSFFGARGDVRNIGKSYNQLEKEFLDAESQLANDTDRLNVIDTLLAAQSKNLDLTKEQADLVKQFPEYSTETVAGLIDEKKHIEDNIEKNKKKSNAAKEGIDNYKKQAKAAEKVADTTKAWGDAFSNVLGGVDAMLDAFGVAEDDTARLWIQNTMHIADMIVQTIILTASLHAMGVAANSALGVIGWIAMALQGIASLFAAIFGSRDKRLQKQIEEQQRLVEGLEHQYNKLEKAIEKAYSITSLERNSRLAAENINRQIRAYEQMIALEQDKKDSDSDEIQEWYRTIDDLKQQRRELNEEIIEGLGAITNYREGAREFVDAWLEAFEEVGDGMDGLKESYADIIKNIVSEQAALRISERFLSPLYAQIENALGDSVFSIDEAERINKKFEEIAPMINDFLEGFFKGFESLGSNSGELIGLEKGIQNITEQTAEVIASYLNSIRFLVADSNQKYTSIVEWLSSNDVTVNPMLSELRTQTKLITNINSLLNNVSSSHPNGGIGLKVIM